MNDAGLQALVDRPTLRERVRRGDLPDWAVSHHETFRATMLDDRDGEPFPCYFGNDSERRGDALYISRTRPKVDADLLKPRAEA